MPFNPDTTAEKHWFCNQLFDEIKILPVKEKIQKSKILDYVLKTYSKEDLFATKKIKDQLSTTDLVEVLGQDNYSEVCDYQIGTFYRILTDLNTLLKEDIKTEKSDQKEQILKNNFFDNARNKSRIFGLVSGEMSNILYNSKINTEITCQFAKDLPIEDLERVITWYDKKNEKSPDSIKNEEVDQKIEQIKNYIVGKYASEYFSREVVDQDLIKNLIIPIFPYTDLNDSDKKWLLDIAHKEINILTNLAIRRLGNIIRKLNDEFYKLSKYSQPLIDKKTIKADNF